MKGSFLNLIYFVDSRQLTVDSQRESMSNHLVPPDNHWFRKQNKNDCSGWMRILLGLKMPGLLPSTFQPRQGLQVLPHTRLQLFLLPWCEGQGACLGLQDRGTQEEAEPVNSEEKCQAQGGVSEKEANPSSSCASWKASQNSSIANCFIRASPGCILGEGLDNAILFTAGWQCNIFSCSYSWNSSLTWGLKAN